MPVSQQFLDFYRHAPSPAIANMIFGAYYVIAEVTELIWRKGLSRSERLTPPNRPGAIFFYGILKFLASA
jgi:hypothetical protein